MTSTPTPGDKLRAYAAARGWPQGDLDYLLGVLGEAVLVERHRASRVAQDWAARPEALTQSGFVIAEFIGRDIEAGE